MTGLADMAPFITGRKVRVCAIELSRLAQYERASRIVCRALIRAFPAALERFARTRKEEADMKRESYERPTSDEVLWPTIIATFVVLAAIVIAV